MHVVPDTMHSAGQSATGTSHGSGTHTPLGFFKHPINNKKKNVRRKRVKKKEGIKHTRKKKIKIKRNQ